MADKNLSTHRDASHLRQLLTQKNFGFYFAATSISTLGSSVAQLGLSLALLVAGYKSSIVGIVLASQTVPLLVFTLAGGVLGDRLARGRLMVASDLLRFFSQGILAVFLAAGHPPVGVLILLGACIGIGNAFYRPAARGIVPQIVVRDQLKTANTLTSMSGSLTTILGPAIGGILVGFGGGVFAITADSLSYLASAALLTFVRFPAGTAPEKTSFLRELQLGAVEFRGHRWLPSVTGQIAVVNAISLGMLFVIGPSLFAHLKNGPQHWGFVTSFIGVGAFLGGLIVMRFAFGRPLLMIQLCIAIMAAPLILLALHASLLPLMLSSGVLGVGMAIANTLFQTTLQNSIPIELLSRVSSIVQLVAMGLIPIGYSLSGPAAAFFGAQRSLGFGACFVLLTVVGMLLAPEIRTFRQPE
jgi:MFS family permease